MILLFREYSEELITYYEIDDENEHTAGNPEFGIHFKNLYIMPKLVKFYCLDYHLLSALIILVDAWL